MQAAVRAPYTASKAKAVWRRRGVSRSSVGPGASAKKSWRPAMASCGKSPTNRTMMPMPPIHWVKARHMKSTGPTAEKSVIVVAPVVVSEDTIST